MELSRREKSDATSVKCDEKGKAAKDFYVRAEIIVPDEPEFVTEIAIARNTATKVSELARQEKSKNLMT